MEADPVAEFARRLRELRASAGSPSFRELARITHYASSTLAEATAGKRLPTEAVVRAFATACGADPDHWAGLLRDSSAPPALAPAQAPAARRRWRWVAAGAGLLAAGLAIGFLAHPSPAPVRASPPSAPFTAVPAAVPSRAAMADGEDPMAAGCTADATMRDKAPILLRGVQIGALELRWSARCGGGWARAYLYPAQPTMMAQVTVAASDGRQASLADLLIKQVPVYTDLIVPDADGCLSARAVVLTNDPSPITTSLPCE
jgi:transcriptional regulator with XRE-family HTH domain